MLTKEVLQYFWQYIIARLGNYVLNTTTINSHPLSSDISLTAQDVNAVSNTTTINSHPLSSDISLTAQDVNALPNNEVVSVLLGGTGYNTIVDSTYTTPRYRASTLRSSSATPSYNGTINWVYE